MRLLLVVQRLHHVRYYESVIRHLAGVGHQIVIGVQSRGYQDRPEVKTFIDGLRREQPNISLWRVPNRRVRHARFCGNMRLLRDYTRYQRPGLEGAAKSATRVLGRLPARLWPREEASAGRRTRAANRRESRLAALEAITPLDPEIRYCLRLINPHLLLVTPMVSLGSCQMDFVAAARDLGIPSVLGVASWDNLTNKGLVKVMPDRVLVWNERQKAEAVALHRIPASRVLVTGAQLFDSWFERTPQLSRSAFCARLGLDPSRPIVLYVASSIFIRRNEPAFVAQWLDALRNAPQAELRDSNVVIRPYPKSENTAEHWEPRQFGSHENVVAFPLDGRMPLLEPDRADYFDSLYHCDAVVGINTSCMLEAAILGRPCFTLKLPELAESQDGMPHYAYLESEGFVTPSTTIPAHLQQLAAAVGPDRAETCRANVEGFLRPHGLSQPASPVVARALTELAETPGQRYLSRLGSRILRLLGWPLFYAAESWHRQKPARPRKPSGDQLPEPARGTAGRLVTWAEQLARYDPAQWLFGVRRRRSAGPSGRG